jgi:hypothetical protein
MKISLLKSRMKTRKKVLPMAIYYYHIECYRKVANMSKLEKTERNPKNEIQPASVIRERLMESEVSEL